MVAQSAHLYLQMSSLSQKGLYHFRVSMPQQSVSTDDSAEVEIELTADLSVSSTPRSDSTTDERIARMELELFEQSEKMTLINRNLLRNQLALQDSLAQNSMLKVGV